MNLRDETNVFICFEEFTSKREGVFFWNNSRNSTHKFLFFICEHWLDNLVSALGFSNPCLWLDRHQSEHFLPYFQVFKETLNLTDINFQRLEK